VHDLSHAPLRLRSGYRGKAIHVESSRGGENPCDGRQVSSAQVRAHPFPACALVDTVTPAANAVPEGAAGEGRMWGAASEATRAANQTAAGG